jgi:CRISPR-associated protein Csd1
LAGLHHDPPGLDLRSELMANLYAAALEGTAPPVSLLKPILDQLQSRILRDENYRAIWDESRFSLLKLIINRHHRSRNEHNMQLEPKLTANTPDAAYNCGRLLSVFDSLQRAAHRAEAGAGSKLNTTLAERYFGSASSNPNGAFSLMWRLHMHHLKKLRQKGEKGQKSAAGYQRSIRDICRCFQAPGGESAPQFPRVFTLIQQGRFALGYYQQEAERAEQYWLWLERQKAAGKPPANAEDAETEFLFTEEDEPLNNPQQ